VKDGVDDLVVTLPGYTPGRFPIMEALELPFMTNTAESASAAAWDFLQQVRHQRVCRDQDFGNLGA
jgi:TRAP-type C4-dicarboxylate transport system substrate-binding protein